jgi:hypothetical protein
MAAMTQVSHAHSPRPANYDRKLAEGKTTKEALRSLKRRISDIIHTALVTEARQQASMGPGGQSGSVSNSRATGLHPAPSQHRRSTSKAVKNSRLAS